MSESQKTFKKIKRPITARQPVHFVLSSAMVIDLSSFYEPGLYVCGEAEVASLESSLTALRVNCTTRPSPLTRVWTCMQDDAEQDVKAAYAVVSASLQSAFDAGWPVVFFCKLGRNRSLTLACMFALKHCSPRLDLVLTEARLQAGSVKVLTREAFQFQLCAFERSITGLSTISAGLAGLSGFEGVGRKRRRVSRG